MDAALGIAAPEHFDSYSMPFSSRAMSALHTKGEPEKQ
jgi:hypothetical protein